MKKRGGGVMQVLIAVGLVGIVVAFQNCANVQLEQEAVVAFSQSAGSLNLCLKNAYQNYTVKNHFVVNLNAANRGKSLAIDSDADGLTDVEELQYGFNPLARYSQSRLLDGICMELGGGNDCRSYEPSCSGIKNNLGLTDCDIKALHWDVFMGHPNLGIDTDQDGIPDLLELLRKTDPKVSDALADPDGDNLLSEREIQLGRNPFYFDNDFDPRLLTQESFGRVQDGSCPGEAWALSVTQMPILIGPRFTDTAVSNGDVLSLSHEENENVILLIFKLTPKAGFGGNDIVLYRKVLLGKAQPSFHLTEIDLVKAGEVLR